MISAISTNLILIKVRCIWIIYTMNIILL
jgi:hypothetical protein